MTKVYGESFCIISKMLLTEQLSLLLTMTWLLWKQQCLAFDPSYLITFQCIFVLCIFAHDTCFFLLLCRGNGDFQGHLVFKGKQGSASQDPRCILLPHCDGKQSLETCNSTFTSHPHLAAPHRGMSASRGAPGHPVLREWVNQDLR